MGVRWGSGGFWIQVLGCGGTFLLWLRNPLDLVIHALLLPFHVLGQRLVSPGLANETSSILVESVTRSSTETCYSAIPKASSDASKVTSKGAGLSKAFVGQKSSFLVDCSKAGRQPGPAPGEWGSWAPASALVFPAPVCSAHPPL